MGSVFQSIKALFTPGAGKAAEPAPQTDVTLVVPGMH